MLAAHTGYIGRVFFDYIRYLNIGDEITITNFWDTLSYRVTDKQIYKKYESSNCYITDGKDFLTLITCAHGGADRYYEYMNLGNEIKEAVEEMRRIARGETAAPAPAPAPALTAPQ